MTIPDFQSLMLPVLVAASNGEVRIGDVVNLLAEEFALTVEERAQLLPSGGQTLFANRVHWAKTYLSKAGLVEITRRGYFRITDRGKTILQSNPSRIDNSFLAQFQEFNKFVKGTQSEGDGLQAVAPTPIDPQARTPDETMREAHREIEASLAQDLLDRVRSAPPDFFERLMVNLLLSMGFGGSVSDAGRALGRTGDDGVDGVIDQDALGLDRVYIQAKRYASGNNVGSGAIRDFFGSLDRHKASKGLFVTTSGFSPSAVETAQYLSKRIVLIDGDQLAKLMIRYNVGCRVEQRLEIKKIDEDYFE
jgi:restriction system protein